MSQEQLTSCLNTALEMYREGYERVVGEVLSPIQVAATITRARQHLIDKGFTYIDRGRTRDIFVVPSGKRVVKIQPIGSSNNREIEMSRKSVPCLVPVLRHSICGGWLVMPYAEEHPSGEVPISDKEFVEDRISFSGWTVQDFGDIRYINEEPHLCDYGAPWKKLH